MKSSIAILFLLICFSADAAAQVNVGYDEKADAFKKNVYGIGFSGGFASGIGLSVRHHGAGKTSEQIVIGVFKSKDNVFFSIGGGFQFDLVRGKTTRFHLSSATSYMYNGDTKNNYEAPFRFGLGAGGEIEVSSTFHISLEGLFTYFSDGSIVPLPQVALHYYFY